MRGINKLAALPDFPALEAIIIFMILISIAMILAVML
jgi:hypothetical protein